MCSKRYPRQSRSLDFATLEFAEHPMGCGALPLRYSLGAALRPIVLPRTAGAGDLQIASDMHEGFAAVVKCGMTSFLREAQSMDEHPAGPRSAGSST